MTGGCSEEGEEGAMGSTAGGGGGVRVGEAMEQLVCSMAGAAGGCAVGRRGLRSGGFVRPSRRGQLILATAERRVETGEISECLSVEPS